MHDSNSISHGSDLPASPHASDIDTILSHFCSSKHGLDHAAAETLLKRFGKNSLPETKPTNISLIFIRQFASPLIYVLVVAVILSLIIKEWSDASFIAAVLIINGIIGTVQEHSAQRAATALRHLVTTHCRVLREGDSYEINSEQLVPGDILLLESGDKIPADVRLLSSHDLEVDESLLTGESSAVLKNADLILDTETALSDRLNMLFAGSLVQRGRGRGIVIGTALKTELGKIAESVLAESTTKAPLQIRLERFTHRIAIIVGIAAVLMAGIALMRGMPLADIFLLTVALAVSAIPEGLPVAITVALAIGTRKMAKRNVIVRQLVAVEALGSCTYIATDKTGTLTINQLTANAIVLPTLAPWQVTGSGASPDGNIISASTPMNQNELKLVERLCLAAILANDGSLNHRNDGWTHHGDAVDVAMLVMAHKAQYTRAEALNSYPELAVIPFESERMFYASLNNNNGQQVFVKGALERLLPMCTRMAGLDEDTQLDQQALTQQAHALASQGYRIIALASGSAEVHDVDTFNENDLQNLTLLGLVGMIDPLRDETKTAIQSCLTAGIEVAMITGDHPVTALAIARELKLADSIEQIVTGPKMRQAINDGNLDQLTQQAHVFARVEPQQKFDIIQSLQRNNHFVAVSGDGANDAPALKASHVGVAMGKGGTDVARESADLILTDDNFSSIVAGIEEGRIAYANVRKVVFLLISTGMAELVLFTLALFTGLPLPLLAVQLLWLNLVTNGIQDVALAFEPAEGNELNRPPRSPQEAIFNRLMIERVIISALVIGVVAFFVFQLLLSRGFNIDEARNGTLLLMVLFENIHVFNCRSETQSVFRQNPFSNPILLLGTAAAQLIHIGAMYTPWLSDVLHIQPVSLQHWFELLTFAFIVLIIMELHKRLFVTQPN